MFSAEFLYFDFPGAQHAHCASIARTRDGGLVVAWYVYPELETRDARIVVSRWDPATDAWERAKPVELGLRSTVANPVVYVSPDGVLWLHFVVLRGAYWDSAEWQTASSEDGGRTFTPRGRMDAPEGSMIRHAPVFLEDGRGLMPVYSDRTKRSFMYTSDPPYIAWRETHAFGSFPVIQGSLIQANDRLLAFFRPSEDPRFCWRSASRNEGRSWSDPVRMTLPNPLSGLAAFAVDDTVGLVYNHTEHHRRYPLSVSTSSGPLTTWSDPKSIDAASFEVSYPSFTVDDAGLIHGVYTYNRKFIKYVCFDTEWLNADHERD